MNKFFCIFFILLFISKTENVFSNNLIFDVNNVEIKGKINNSLSNQKLIELAFEKAFIVFVNKILLKEDALNLYNTQSSTIKDLVLTYQVIKNKKNVDGEIISIFNIKFDQKKINKFLAKKKISYVDISNISLSVLPVLIKGKNISLYEENFFYKNWNKFPESVENIDDKLINYSLALENIEDLRYINSIKNNIDLIEIKKINSFYENKNYALLVIYSTEKKFKAFIKTSIKNKNVDRNIDLNFYPKDKNKSYIEAIIRLKNEINQIWKEQNLVDVNTPSFLDLFLETKKIDDYLKLKNILDNIDLIENYSVLEMTSKYLKIRVKYRGKIIKIKEKISKQNASIKIIENVWRLKIK
jgi:hypothetical protein